MHIYVHIYIYMYIYIYVLIPCEGFIDISLILKVLKKMLNTADRFAGL